MEPQYKNLGLVNGWVTNPPEYEKCVELQHIVQESRMTGWACYHVYYCPTCNIKWEVDSSG